MKKAAFFQGVIAMVLAFGLNASVFAHTHLYVTSPKDGEVVSAPTVMMLTFDGEARLLRLRVVGSAGPLDIGFTPTAAVARRFHIPMPFMAAGEYVATWTAIGEDGHSVSGEFGFTVDPSAPAAIMDHSDSPSQGSHSH